MKDIVDYAFLKQLKNLAFVDEIWLFGSRARGDCSPRSDIDLAILCNDEEESDWLKVIDIIENADSLLKIDCIKFDRNFLSDELIQNIMKDKKVLYAKK